MAIAPTGAIYKSLIFDGEDSRDYGVYITGQAVFNAPEREVEMITIPARNGLFALDQGRFENIEVTYPAGIFADSDADFAQAISDFRNFLCSRKGYCRLTDDYNPDEYRMAIYKSGLDVKLSELKAGEFNITFICKPQRFLMSGEAAVSVASGDTIFNPTLFESSPMLEVEGYGYIRINEKYRISLSDGVMGRIVISDYDRVTYQLSKAIYFQSDLFNSGDTITLNELSVIGGFRTGARLVSSINSITESNSNFTTTYRENFTYNFTVNTVSLPITFTAGTASSVTSTATITVTLDNAETRTITRTITVSYTPAQVGTTSRIYIIISQTHPDYAVTWRTDEIAHGQIVGNSTVSQLGHPTYIDCDLGEAYQKDGGTIVSLNRYISLGSDLPELEPGQNTITHANTITSLKIVPRWWKL